MKRKKWRVKKEEWSKVNTHTYIDTTLLTVVGIFLRRFFFVICLEYDKQIEIQSNKNACY